MGAMFEKYNSPSFLLLLPLLVLVSVGQICLQHTNAGSIIEFLPGFDGPLPFEHETGYVGVDEGDDLQVFYYFVKSESKPKEDPLLFWITGGPGCSSLSALFYEIGPLMFKMVEYNGSLPTLLSNPSSWTKTASIVFIDLPIGTGFTYTKSGRDPHSTDLQFFDHAYEFTRKWLWAHPEFISNPFYFGGDSYSGIPVPIIAQLISNGNEAGLDQSINLKGYILGNPLTNPIIEHNYQVLFAHGMGLIPDELYESMKMICKGEYREDHVDPNNFHCLRNLKAFDECIDGIHKGNILEADCGYVDLRPSKSIRRSRALDERINELYNAKQSLSAMRCRNEGYGLLYYWANDNSVRDALHVQKGSIGTWERCNRVTLAHTILDVRSYHLNLSNKGYRALVYSGDHDMIVTHQSTQAWIKELNFPIVDQWRSWKVNDQIAGDEGKGVLIKQNRNASISLSMGSYTRTYANNMTFATVKGGGHTAPDSRPKECFGMFKRWISHQPL